MFLNLIISYRHLFSKHTFGIISFTSLLSVIGLSFGISSLIIISSFSDGFKNEIYRKLSSIDAHIRINSMIDNVSEEDMKFLTKTISKVDSIRAYSPYIESYAMVRNSKINEGVISYGLEQKSLTQIINLDTFIVEGVNDFADTNSIIIGVELAKKIGAKINDEIYLFDLRQLIINNLVSARKMKITGIYKTDFQEYDKMLVFIPIDISKHIFTDIPNYSGILLSASSFDSIESVYSKIKLILNDKPFFTSSWSERHNDIIGWLLVYDTPIKIIMFFIILVGIFNIIASLWMISIEKGNEIGILRSIGLRKNDIFQIHIFYSLILVGLGVFFGYIISFLVLIFQNKFHFISLSAEIYFMNYLPVKYSLYNFLVYPISAICITFILSLIPAKVLINREVVKAIRYE